MKVDSNTREKIREQIEKDKQWVNDNLRYPTIKIKPQSFLNYLETITLLLDDLDSVEIQEEGVIGG